MTPTATTPQPRTLLDIREAAVVFPKRTRTLRRRATPLRALDGVSLTLAEGETLAVVGESGSGKTTLARAIVRIHPLERGSVRYRARNGDWFDLHNRLDATQTRAVRRDIRMVFQDPFGSLNPRKRIGEIVAEPLRRLRPDGERWNRRTLTTQVSTLLERVGLDPSMASRYPHALSGGQRQRVGIARAIATQPRLLLCDEAVSALDVSVQAQILTLLAQLQRELDLAVLFITHDLTVARAIANRIAVMYAGRIVEIAASDALFDAPEHPYSRELLASVPVDHPRQRRQKPRPATAAVLDAGARPMGCPFHPRCPHAIALCRERPPSLDAHADRWTACHLAGELPPANPIPEGG